MGQLDIPICCPQPTCARRERTGSVLSYRRRGYERRLLQHHQPGYSCRAWALRIPRGSHRRRNRAGRLPTGRWGWNGSSVKGSVTDSVSARAPGCVSGLTVIDDDAVATSWEARLIDARVPEPHTAQTDSKGCESDEDLAPGGCIRPRPRADGIIHGLGEAPRQENRHHDEQNPLRMERESAPTTLRKMTKTGQWTRYTA